MPRTGIREVAVARLSSLFLAGVPQLLISFALFQGSSYLIQLIAARLLGPSEYGQLRVLETIVAIALIPASSGIPSAVVTYVAAAKTEEDQGRLLFNATICGAAVASVIAIIMVAGALTLPSSSSEVRYLGILACLLPFATVGRIVVNYFQGRSQISRVALYNSATSLSTIVLAVCLIPIWHLEGWVATRVIAEIMFALVLVVIARHRFRAVWQWSQTRRLASFGLFAALGLGVARAQDTAYTLYIAHFDGTDHDVGNFGLAFIVYSGILLLSGAVNAAILPKMAAHGAEPRRALTILASSLKYTLAVLVAINLFSVVAYPLAVRFVFGSEYDSSIPVFFILVAGTFIYAIASGIGTLFYALDQPSVSLAVNTGALFSGFVLSYLLIPSYGIRGAAFAVLINTVLRLIGFAAVAYFRFVSARPHPHAEGFPRSAAALPPPRMMGINQIASCITNPVPFVLAISVAVAVLGGIVISAVPTPIDIPALQWLLVFVGLVVVGTGVFLAFHSLRETLWAWSILTVLLLGSVWKTYSYYEHAQEPSFWGDKKELAWVSSSMMVAGARWITAAVFIVSISIVLSMFLIRGSVSPNAPLREIAHRRALQMALGVGIAAILATMLRVSIGIGLMGTAAQSLPLRLDAVLNRFVTDIAPGLLVLAFWILDRGQRRAATWVVGVLILAQGFVFTIASTSRLGIAQYALPVVFLWLLTGRITRGRWIAIVAGAALIVFLIPFATDLRIARLNSSEGLVPSVRTALNMTSGRFTEQGVGTVASQSVDHVATRFIGAEGVWYALNNRPERFSASRIFDLVFADRVGQWYTAEIVGITRPGDYRSPGILGVSMLLAGDQIMVMVLLSLYVFGMAFIWRWLSTFRTWPVALAIWGKVLLIFTSEGTLLAPNIISAIGVALVCEFAYRRFFAPEPEPVRALSPRSAAPSLALASPADGRKIAIPGARLT